MPLARIITRTPQDAVGASELLRSRGYTVETVSPEEFRITPAELELNLQHCRAAEAVERALALVEAGTPAPAKAEAPTEPGPESPPQEEKIPIAFDITGQPVEFAEPEKTSRPKGSGLGKSLAAMFAGVGKSLGQPWSDFRRRRIEQRELKLEAQAASQREEARRHEELARERLWQEVERQREATELAERRRREQIAAQQQAQQERERAAALREAAIAAQAESRDEEPAPQVASPVEEPVVAAPESAANLAVLPPPAEPVLEEKPSPRLQPLRQAVRRQRPRPVQARRGAPIVISRTAVATACGLGLLLLAGFVAYANRRPASQFLPEAPREVRQDVPFGAATIAPSVVDAQRTPVAKRSAAVRPASRKPSAGQPSVRRSSREARQDEVVVRHLTPPQPQPSTANLRRHSDED